MPRIKLTERAVARLEAPAPSGRQIIHWDSELKGFGVLCSGVTNAKSYIVQRELPGGKSRRVTVAAVAEMQLREARTAAAELLVAMRRGEDPKTRKPAGLTLRGAFDSYLANRKDLRPASVTVYRKVVPGYLAPWLDMPLREITAEMVEDQHREVQAEIAARGRYGGEAAANLAFVVLRLLWNYAAERDSTMPPKNPVGRLRRGWFAIQPRTRMVPAEHMPKFYRAVLELANAIQRDYVLLLLFTGMRKSEAASLTWEDVDLVRRVLRVPAARTKAGRKLDLPMTDVVHRMLVARRALGRDKFVFPANSRSGHIEDTGLEQVAEACGVRVSAHDLRRTFITIAEACDISVLALKALVNHATGRDVTSGYVQMSTERLRQPAQRVCDEIKRLCEVEPLPEGVARLV
jgi:integrase